MVSSRQRVGVDIEQVTQKVARVKHKFLSPKEQDMIAAIQSSNTNQTG